MILTFDKQGPISILTAHGEIRIWKVNARKLRIEAPEGVTVTRDSTEIERPLKFRLAEQSKTA